ncbi:RNA polymerase sigma factor [Maribacter polysiphoniae]|uniref:RNA polymerase sigma factor n=2 Tax=Maribacter polysiphoniae TaxID=429344 RepID=A0A316DVE2_9FLAO|nr:RNA polymerase sigma factor [Maribacter polysiphoniae]MBD1262993.1 RNA polymerase sigma factor [Maribacter polysiphoniae]PWK22074.1 RNA polymerase sigma-70 factor (ECF subfamily) [Maribacter polysiphoniae]
MSPNKIFDALLVLQYQSGDKKALGMLVKRHHTKFCGHANWYLGDLDASKDVVQDCWGIIINKLGNLRDPNSFSSWAMRIVTRKSIDFLKQNRNKREKLRHYGYTNLEDTTNEEGNAEIIKLQQAIKSLPNDQQIVLRLFYTQEYTLIEISNILDISVGTVKSRLFHAREKLKTILKV